MTEKPHGPASIATAPPVRPDPRIERARPVAGWRVTDVMALVAALALACGWLRALGAAWADPGAYVTLGGGGRVWLARLASLIAATLPSLAVATLAIIVLQCARHGVTRRLVARPGMLACGVASVFLAAPIGGALLWVVFRGLVHGHAALRLATSQAVASVYDSMADWGYLIGFAVAVAWIVLGVVRGWKGESDGYDRIGRLLGWAWVVLAPAAVFTKLELALGLLF